MLDGQLRMSFCIGFLAIVLGSANAMLKQHTAADSFWFLAIGGASFSLTPPPLNYNSALSDDYPNYSGFCHSYVFSAYSRFM